MTVPNRIIKVSQLENATSINPDDLFQIVQGGENKKIVASLINLSGGTSGYSGFSGFSGFSGAPGSGTGGGFGRSVIEDGAAGDGITDDKAAIELCISTVSAAGGGAVYFPSGSYLVSGASKISVPASIRLVGESMDSSIIIGPGFEAFGSNVTFEDLEFRDPSVGGATPAVLPCTLKTINYGNFAVRKCRLNRAWIDVRNTQDPARVKNIVVRDNFITGDFTYWSAVTGVNCITIMGVESLDISNNRFLDIVFPHRVLKIQASTAYTGAGTVIGEAHTAHVVISGNIIIGEMKSGKQCVDLYSGCRDLIFHGNIFDITQSGLGCSLMIESKTGQSAQQVQSYTQRQSWCGNIFKGDCDQLGAMSGGYSMYWEGEEQTVDFSGNIIDHRSVNSLYGIDFRGLHHVTVTNNSYQSDTTQITYRSFSFGNCQRITANVNPIATGSIYVYGGANTTGGDPYTGDTEQITFVGNNLQNFRSDHGGIECIGLSGAPNVTIIGNTLDSDLGTGTQALVYLRNSNFGSVITIGNNGNTTDVGRNRYLKVTANVTLEREYLNSWQSAALQVYDEANRRLEIGSALGSLDVWLNAATASEASIWFRQNSINRVAMSLLTNGTDWQLRARDTAGGAIDSPLSLILASGGLLTIGGSTSRTTAFTGVVRPSTDALIDFGASSLHWRSIYSAGGMYTGTTNTSINTTVGDTDHVLLLDCSSGNRTLTLASGLVGRNGKDIVIRRVDTNGANTATIQRNADPDTILDGVNTVTSITLAPGATAWLRYDHTNTRYVRIL